MKTMIFTGEINRAGWPSGAWDDEPDRVQWETGAGLPGLAVRTDMGHWCGYAAVEPGHRFHSKDYSDIEIEEHPHGGLTYSGACSGRICHIVDPGEADGVWWFGFDCAHLNDYSPGRDVRLPEDVRVLFQNAGNHDIYCSLAYVKREVEMLARQLI